MALFFLLLWFVSAGLLFTVAVGMEIIHSGSPDPDGDLGTALFYGLMSGATAILQLIGVLPKFESMPSWGAFAAYFVGATVILLLNLIFYLKDPVQYKTERGIE